MSFTHIFRRTLSSTAINRSTVSTLRLPVASRQNLVANTPKTLQSRPRPFSTTATNMGVHNLDNKSSFDSALAVKDKLMVLDCFATWCGPCKVIAPQVVKFSDEYPDATFYKIDVDEVPDVAQELGIRAMPTFLLFKNGERVGEVVGANPKVLEAAIKNNIA